MRTISLIYLLAAVWNSAFAGGDLSDATKAEECRIAGGQLDHSSCVCPNKTHIVPHEGVACDEGDKPEFYLKCSNSGGRREGDACFCDGKNKFFNPYVETCKDTPVAMLF